MNIHFALMYRLNEYPYDLANLALNGQVRHERQRLQDLLADWLHRTQDVFALPDSAWISRP